LYRNYRSKLTNQRGIFGIFVFKDMVLSSLQELSKISRSCAWGYMETITINALYRINILVYQQLLMPGVISIDLYKIWLVTSECLPIIKHEISLWANSMCES